MSSAEGKAWGEKKTGTDSGLQMFPSPWRIRSNHQLHLFCSPLPHLRGEMRRLSSASLCLWLRGVLLMRYSSSDLYRSPPSWAIAFRGGSFCCCLPLIYRPMWRGYYQVSSSDCSAQLSCRESSEGPHVCGYTERLLFIFLLCTFAENRNNLICHFCTPTKRGSGRYGLNPVFPFLSVSLQMMSFFFRKRKQHLKEYWLFLKLIRKTENSNPGKKESQIQILCRNYREKLKHLETEKSVFIVVNTLVIDISSIFYI